MKIKINPKLVYRVPQFSITETLEECWDELKESIKISSFTFFERIEHIESNQISELPQNVYQTIWKYYNRAKFRSTPYGSFAGVGTITLGNTDETEVIISKKQHLHRFVDWQNIEKSNCTFDELAKRDALLFSNSSYYRVGDDIRFLRKIESKFELADVDSDEQLLGILQLCKRPIAISIIVKQIQSNADATVLLLKELIDMQLLMHDHHPNIIGQDYFQRIGLIKPVVDKEYIIAERPLVKGEINQDLLKHIPELLDKLQSITPINKNQRLQQFISQFSRKFEQVEIPLMIALDPELGVGYDDLEQSSGADDFINKLIKYKNKESSNEIVISTIMNEVGKQGVPILNSIDLSLFETGNNSKKTELPLPNTLSILCSFADEKVILEHAGGSCANALLGRFTIAMDNIESISKELARSEAAANKDVLFFDIGYISENKVDNINRRKSIYDHQVNILTYDTTEGPLALDDLYLSVHGEDLVLRSRKLNKRLIPRLASAYNFQRSDLSVFKLLSDLQNQSLQVDLNFSIKRIIPGLDYYPRVVFKNIIISSRSWRLSYKNAGRDIASFKSVLAVMGICQFVKTGLADQTLCFNIYEEKDLAILYDIIQREKSIQVEEVIIPQNSIVKDSDSKPYQAEFIISVYHEEKNYNGINSWNTHTEIETQKVFLPGDQWLYFEIFCHEYRADMLLCNNIAAFLDANKKRIYAWFFIRYHENGQHLRLRIRLNHYSDAFIITRSLTKHLEYEINCGLISDIAIKTYFREVERYGADLIDVVEVHFAIDSTYVLNLLQDIKSSIEKYMLCIEAIKQVELAGIFGAIEFEQLISKLYHSYNEEHGFTSAEFKILNERYQQYVNTPILKLSIPLQDAFNYFTDSLISAICYSEQKHRGRLFSDLMHMHINRLFDSNQRLHEGVIYYFTYKNKLKEKAGTKFGLQT